MLYRSKKPRTMTYRQREGHGRGKGEIGGLIDVPQKWTPYNVFLTR